MHSFIWPLILIMENDLTGLCDLIDVLIQVVHCVQSVYMNSVHVMVYYSLDGGTEINYLF